MFFKNVDEDRKRNNERNIVDFDQSHSDESLKRLLDRRSEMPGQAEALIKIEEIVDYILQDRSPAYRQRNKAVNGLSETRVGRYLRKVYPLHLMFSSRNEYSEKPAAFLFACWHARRMMNRKVVSLVKRRSDADTQYAEEMNMIVEAVRNLSKGEWFWKGAQNRGIEGECKGEKAAFYVAAVINRCLQTDIILIDCYYEGLASAHVTIDRAWCDFQDFIELLDFNKDYHHLAGYVWSIEQCRGDGFHARVALMFNGPKVVSGIDQGAVIGELWAEHVTLGRGRYSICNLTSDRPDGTAIGTVSRCDEKNCIDAVRGLQDVFSRGDFFNRDDNYLRIKTKSMQTFGTGPIPDITGMEVSLSAVPAPWLEAYLEREHTNGNVTIIQEPL